VSGIVPLFNYDQSSAGAFSTPSDTLPSHIYTLIKLANRSRGSCSCVNTLAELHPVEPPDTPHSDFFQNREIRGVKSTLRPRPRPTAFGRVPPYVDDTRSSSDPKPSADGGGAPPDPDCQDLPHRQTHLGVLRAERRSGFLSALTTRPAEVG